MCYRYLLATPATEISTHFGLNLGDLPPFEPRLDIRLTEPIAVIGRKRQQANYGLTMMSWGLIPSWAPDQKGPRPGNARSETIFEKPMFRESIQQRRCLIPATGFYEWETVDKKTKIRHTFQWHDERLFAFAGIWDRWLSPTGEKILTVCIITTTPNDLVAPLHDRMPVILTPDQYPQWTAPDTKPSELQALLRPLPSDLMKSTAPRAAYSASIFD